MEAEVWRQTYERPMEESVRWFHYELKELEVQAGAAAKYDPAGHAKAFPGLAAVHWFLPAAEHLHQLAEVQQYLQRDLTQVGLASKFAFLPPATFHLTLADLVVAPNQALAEKVSAGVESVFRTLNRQGLTRPDLFTEGLAISAGISLVLRVHPQHARDLETIHWIRRELQRELYPLGDTVCAQDPLAFIGHITLAYIVQPLPTADYSRAIDIIRRYERYPVGPFQLDGVELREFRSMEQWSEPLCLLQLA